MNTYVDLDSGTFGAADAIVEIYLDPEEVEEFGELSDNARSYVAMRMHKYGDEFSEALELWNSP